MSAVEEHITELEQRRSEFTRFFESAEPRLRIALSAAFGQDRGREATSEALSYAWEHWDRVSAMDNPIGYLYRVGQSKARLPKRRHLWARRSLRPTGIRRDGPITYSWTVPKWWRSTWSRWIQPERSPLPNRVPAGAALLSRR